MKSLLGKYFIPCLIGIILEVVVLFVVLVENLRINFELAGSIYTFFSSYTVLLNIFDFISDWAILISVLPILVVLSLFLSDIRKDQRNQALGRIHNWAQNAVLLLADYRQRDIDLQGLPELRYEGTKVLIDALKKHSMATPADAKAVGGKLEMETKRAIRTFQSVDDKVNNHDESAYDDLKILQRDLAEVMMSTFEMRQKF